MALAADGDEIEVWGDGEQTRSSMHVDDCVEGIRWEHLIPWRTAFRRA